jgi:copper(I)-binding protein
MRQLKAAEAAGRPDRKTGGRRGDFPVNQNPVIILAMLISSMALPLSARSAAAQESHDMNNMNMNGMKMQMDAPASAGAARIGALDISGGFVRAMLPGQPVGGGYLTIHNGGSGDDRLVSVKSPAAGKVEIHEMKMENNIMKMRELKDGIAVPAGATVKLAPNGLHVMFKQVKTPFRQGETVPVTLNFERAGAVDLSLPVTSPQGN